MKNPLRPILFALAIALIAAFLPCTDRIENSDLVLQSILVSAPLNLIEKQEPPELELDSIDAIFGVYEKWKGDLDSIIQRRRIRVLVPYSKNFFFLEGSEGRGLMYEATQLLDQYFPENDGRSSFQYFDPGSEGSNDFRT